MDKIPKFRRKPKPPTIETSVDRTSTDTQDSAVSALSAVSNSESPVSASGQQKPVKFPKKSAFRSLRLRGSAKRARDSSPASRPSSPPPPTLVVGKDGTTTMIPGDQHLHSRNGSDPGRRMPAFLNLSSQEMEAKYHELVWAERNRIADGSRNESIPDYMWGSYKQVDVGKGVMDRYGNIKPWNHNRVKLQVAENEFDYVNASAIILPAPYDNTKQTLHYIAMQGPTEPSFSHVWRMIAEQIQTPAVIVQLTTMVEGGAIKCHQYFPDGALGDDEGSGDNEDTSWVLNEDNIWGDNWKATLIYDSVEELADGAVEKRKLLLRVEGEKEDRVVWHFLYRRWPDFGVPTLEDLDSFFELMTLSGEYSHPSNPRIIHCSAGVGRTGTFIALEHLMRELESGAFEDFDVPGEESDPVYDLVDLLRQQRRGMVQGEPQYQFIYQVIRKLWMDKYGGTEPENHEPAAKRQEVGDPCFEEGPGPDIGPTSNDK